MSDSGANRHAALARVFGLEKLIASYRALHLIVSRGASMAIEGKMTVCIS
jgi:hypothetical protein